MQNVYLFCFHCKEQIESEKYLSIINWEWMDKLNLLTPLLFRDEMWKLDFHNDCFQEIAGKKFMW